MRFQRDSDGLPDQLVTGLPAAESGQDVPRWLVVLGLTSGLTLLVALLRYAIDLLGVVFVIILVGFALRAVSDWLTEGESVSGWALSALSLGLTGTLVVGLWLVNSRDLGGRELELPGPVQRTVGWLEAKGWGQRVLLPGGAPAGALAGRLASGGGALGREAASAPAPRTASPAALPAAPARRRSAPSPRRAAAGEVEAAAPAQAAPKSAPLVATRVALTASPSAVVVGRSVRLTARIQSEGGAVASGVVRFLASGSPLGFARLRGGVAELVTVDLALGQHELIAVYDGDGAHLPSRSDPVTQLVTRR